MDNVDAWLAPLADTPRLATTIYLLGLIVLAVIADWVTRRVLLRMIGRAVAASPTRYDDALLGRGVISRLAHVVPALVIFLGIPQVPGIPDPLVTVVRNVANAYMIFTVALSLGNLLNAIGDIYEQANPERARSKPIKGYLQLVKILAFIFAGVRPWRDDRRAAAGFQGHHPVLRRLGPAVQPRHAACRRLARNARAERRRRRHRHCAAYRQGAELGPDHHQHPDLAADQRKLQELARHERVGRSAHQAVALPGPVLGALSRGR